MIIPVSDNSNLAGTRHNQGGGPCDTALIAYDKGTRSRRARRHSRHTFRVKSDRRIHTAKTSNSQRISTGKPGIDPQYFIVTRINSGIAIHIPEHNPATFPIRSTVTGCAIRAGTKGH